MTRRPFALRLVVGVCSCTVKSDSISRVVPALKPTVVGNVYS